MNNPDLNKIKKIYGESFAKLCRTLFPTILATEGLLADVITKNFAPSHNLYKKLIEDDEVDVFRDYIYSLVPIQNYMQNVTTKTPEQLLDEAGYILYPECKTESDIQKFKKYYHTGEKICTFNGGRLQTCRVWFAVKKNVKTIKRKNFTNPTREDEYGTSVISIQFTRGETNYLSIKNRYNHYVENPDATFGNNLENIIPGLTYAFCKVYGINLVTQTSAPYFCSAVLASNNLYYIVNSQPFKNIYCDNNIIVDSNKNVIQLDKSKYLVIENYIIDFTKKTIISEETNDSFVNSIGKIKNLIIRKNELGLKEIVITPIRGSDIKITINSRNQIVGYENSNVTKIGNNFLSGNNKLSFIKLPNVKTIGNGFLKYNVQLTEVDFPKLISCGDHFIQTSQNVENVNLPNLTHAGKMFLGNASLLTSISLPKLESVEDYFLSNANKLQDFDAPNLTTVGDNFIYYGCQLKNLNVPNLTIAGSNFLSFNRKITNLSLPKLESVQDCFLSTNQVLETLDAPKLKYINNLFLAMNTTLQNLFLPSLESVGNQFLRDNNQLINVKLPNLIKTGGLFLASVQKLELLKIPVCTCINKRQSLSRLTHITNLEASKELNIFNSLKTLTDNNLKKISDRMIIK